MIKLVATDMDGTLLDENSYLPEGFIEILDRLMKKDIKLVIASGRPYYSLLTEFGPISRHLSYICENGALVVDNNEIIYKSVIDPSTVQEVIKISKSIKGNATVLCSPNCAYVEQCEEDQFSEIQKYYTSLEVVDDISKIEDDILKIAICNFENLDKNLNSAFNGKFEDKLDIVCSGAVWVDIINKGVNKGVALKNLMDTDNISKEETMALGDYYNDIEMLEQAEYSFVMENAPEDMKQHGKYIAASNEEHGVLRAILEYAL